MQKILRDEFAMAAMQALVSISNINSEIKLQPLAVSSYQIADAMLAERAKRQNEEAADYTD